MYVVHSEATKAAVVRLHKEGRRFVAIMEITGVSLATIRRWAAQAGIERRAEGAQYQYDEATRRRAIDLYRGGMSSRRVAERVGCSVRSVHFWWAKETDRSRKPTSTKRTTTPIRTRAVALYLRGLSATEVGDTFGVHRKTILLWVQAAGKRPRPKHRLDHDRIAETFRATGSKSKTAKIHRCSITGVTTSLERFARLAARKEASCT